MPFVSDLGQVLKKARLEKKISLDDLQETTKIRKAYLEAIEEGNYKKLPGTFYVRAFIKSYAEAIGLDPNEVLKLYQNVIPASEPEPVEPIRSTRTSRNSERIGRWASTALVITFVVLIVGIIYYYVNKNYSGTADVNASEPPRITDKADPAPSDPNAAGGAIAEGGEPPQTVQEPPPAAPVTEVKLVRSERGTDYYTVTNASELQIKMTVTGDACWIRVDSLGEKKEAIAEGMFYNGNTEEWKLSNSAYLTFGRANAVELNVNGTIVPVGTDPNVKKLQFDLGTAG